MKSVSILLAALVVTLLGAATVEAQTPPQPRYIKQAVFVRMHYDSSFYSHWYTKSPNGSIDALLEQWFREIRTAYQSTAMTNIDLILLNDFDRLSGPVMNYVDANSNQSGGNTRLIDWMKANLGTGSVTQTSGRQIVTVGRLVNWVFTYQGQGSAQGQVTSTPAIGGSEAHLFVSTIDARGNEYPRDEILKTVMHEFGHIMGGLPKPTAEGCPRSVESQVGGEIMCDTLRRELRFGQANTRLINGVANGALNRCNTAFASKSACENYVDNEICGRLLDYTQIANCQLTNKQSLCSDRFCSQSDNNTRLQINALPAVINNNRTVTAPALR
jgi:hypothetical protein